MVYFSDMELWFWAALASSVFSGVAAFSNKIAVKRNYDTELLILYAGLVSVLIFFPIVLVRGTVFTAPFLLIALSLLSGVLASLGGLFKITALKYIDTTIFYPLTKIISPLIAILFGVAFFDESFNFLEWIGLFASLLIPLLLISKVENTRQNNLGAGLMLVIVTGVLAALVAGIGKYMLQIFDAIFLILFFTSVGVFLGSGALFLLKSWQEGIYHKLRKGNTKSLIFTAVWRASALSLSLLLTLYAFAHNGTLGIVYTINSLYILIPIVLSIVFYNEHWDKRKVIAIALSIGALLLFQ